MDAREIRRQAFEEAARFIETHVEVKGLGDEGISALRPAADPAYVNRKMKLQAAALRKMGEAA